MTAFNMLAEPFQRYLFDEKIQRETAIQEAAIPRIMTTDDNYVLASGTGSGKSLAVFAPLASRKDFDGPGVRILYIAPLVSLLNDQKKRLEVMFSYAGVRVTRWHGDARQSEKRSLLRQPEGVLLMTPESLEAMFQNHPEYIPLLFGSLQSVIVDEIHAFVGTDRGIHLRSLLSRLLEACGQPFRFYALSATIGEDVAPFKSFVDNGRETRVLLDPSMRYTDVQFHYFPVREKGKIPEEAFRCIAGLMAGQRAIIYPNSRADVEEVAYWLSAGGCANSFAYHASIDRKRREEIEDFARTVEDEELALSSTSACDYGLDFGGIGRVIQLNAVPSVSTLVQRAGRSGRRTGVGDIAFVNTDPWGLLQNAACWNLQERGVIERPDTGLSPSKVLAHQIRSTVKETREIPRQELKEKILSNPAFRECGESAVDAVLDHHISADILREADGGKLVLGLVGERYVGHRDSYIAFDARNEYRVMDGRTVIGTIDQNVAVGDCLYLDRRSWKVTGTEGFTVRVRESPGGKPPRFTSESVIVSPEVEGEMRRILAGGETPGYLGGEAASAFGEMLGAFSRMAAMGSGRVPCYVSGGGRVRLYPLAGTKVLNTLSLLFDAPVRGRLLQPNLTKEALLDRIGDILADRPDITGKVLEAIMKGEIVVRSRLEKALPPELQAESIVSRKYDMDAAVAFLEALREGADTLELPVLDDPLAEVEGNAGALREEEPEGLPEKVLVYTVFMSEGECAPAVRKQATAAVEEALGWVHRQAESHGRTLSFILETAGQDGAAVHGPVPEDYDSAGSADVDVDALLGADPACPDTASLLAHAEDEMGCDHVMVLAVVDAKGRSYAQRRLGSPLLGAAILFKGNDARFGSGMVAHEVLHLFGAVDLYPPCQEEGDAAFIRENYPKEVMCDNGYPAGELCICPLTAWAVRFTDRREDWFDRFLGGREAVRVGRKEERAASRGSGQPGAGAPWRGER